MKRMIYTRNRQEPVVLLKGTSNGYSFAIVSFGTHPCAYVAVPKLHCFTYRLLPPIAVHGTITFTNFCPDLDGVWSIGWDYGHGDDYNGREYLYQKINKHGKKWTVEEIVLKAYACNSPMLRSTCLTNTVTPKNSPTR